MNYFLLASPLSSSIDFFNRVTSASFFNSSRSSLATLYSSCSIGVNFFLLEYLAKGLPGFRLLTSASSPPSKYCFVHLCICAWYIPVSLSSDWIYTKKVDKYDKIEDKQRRNKNDRKEKQ